MRNVLACFVVLLCATSAAAANNFIFFVEMDGNDSSCVGVLLGIGGSEYMVRTGAASHQEGPTNSPFFEGASLVVQPRWFGGSSDENGNTCGGDRHGVCAAVQTTLTVGSRTVCTQAITDYSSRTISYTVSKVTEAGQTFWKLVFTSTVTGNDGGLG